MNLEPEPGSKQHGVEDVDVHQQKHSAIKNVFKKPAPGNELRPTESRPVEQRRSFKQPDPEDQSHPILGFAAPEDRPPSPDNPPQTDLPLGHDIDSTTPKQQRILPNPQRTSLQGIFQNAQAEFQNTVYQQFAVMESNWMKERMEMRAEIASLQMQLTDARKECDSLRTQFQVNESRSPRDIVNGFRAINIAIRDFVYQITASILDHYHPGDNVTTLNAANPELMVKLFKKAPLLIQNEKGKGRLIVDFLEVAIAYQLISNLQRLFRNFHLEPLEGIDRVVNDIYSQVRKDESQLNAARWRSTTFNALIPLCTKDGEDWASYFISNILEPLLVGIFGPPLRYRLKPRAFDSLKHIFTLASTWNRDVKSTFFPLDFHAGIPFDPQAMKLYDSKSPVSTVLPTAIAPVRLGLMNSVTYGKEKAEKWVWQEKVVVITEEFFS
jgi:hypothetical protein